MFEKPALDTRTEMLKQDWNTGFHRSDLKTLTEILQQDLETNGGNWENDWWPTPGIAALDRRDSGIDVENCASLNVQPAFLTTDATIFSTTNESAFFTTATAAVESFHTPPLTAAPAKTLRRGNRSPSSHRRRSCVHDCPCKSTSSGSWAVTELRPSNTRPLNSFPLRNEADPPYTHAPTMETSESTLTQAALPAVTPSFPTDLNDFDNDILHSAFTHLDCLPHNDMSEASPPTMDPETPPDDAEHSDEGPLNKQIWDAYARLSFNDCFFLIQTANVILGRDEGQQAEHDKIIIQRRRAAKHLRQQSRRQDAERDLQSYSREPSHNSQRGDIDVEDGDDDNDNDDVANSLRGNIVPGVPSNISEHGGPVSFQDQESSADLVGLPRKNPHGSSSNASIAPKDIYPQVFGETFYRKHSEHEEPEEWVKLPIHTANIMDVKKLSRDHVLIFYCVTEECWRMKITGNGAFINETLHNRNEVVTLQDGDEIFVATVKFKFELPAGQITNDLTTIASAHSESPGQVGFTRGSDSEASVEEASAKPQKKTKSNGKIPKLKLMNTAVTKASGGGPSESKENAPPKVDKGKKRAISSPEEDETLEDDKDAAKAAQSALEQSKVYGNGNVDKEFMPEKRKGPGRPPKNGFISKRDEAALKRKMRQLEQESGQKIPQDKMNQLLEQVRAEQRRKDAQAKAQANGQPVPDIPVPSIETGLRMDVNNAVSNNQTNAQPAGSDSPPAPRAASPRQTRVASPVPPKESFTEEQLKRPTQTYPYLLDEVIELIAEKGINSDLPTIYDQIMKRWPFFKYNVTSTGWQSSVRHNLVADPRFEECGKAGKGKLWKIDYSVPRQRKKTVKQSQPQNTQPPQGLNTMGQNPFSQPYPQPPGMGLAQQNGALQAGPSNQYNSPYGNYGTQQNGGVSVPYPTHNMPVNGPQQMSGPTPQRNGSASRQSSQQPPQPQPPPENPVLKPVINAILVYKNDWLRPYIAGTPDYQRADFDFTKGLNYVSELIGAGKSAIEITPDEAVREPFSRLKDIYDHYLPYLQAVENSGIGWTAVMNGSIQIPRPPTWQQSSSGVPHSMNAPAGQPTQPQPGQPTTMANMMGYPAPAPPVQTANVSPVNGRQTPAAPQPSPLATPINNANPYQTPSAPGLVPPAPVAPSQHPPAAIPAAHATALDPAPTANLAQPRPPFAEPQEVPQATPSLQSTPPEPAPQGVKRVASDREDDGTNDDSNKRIRDS